MFGGIVVAVCVNLKMKASACVIKSFMYIPAADAAVDAAAGAAVVVAVVDAVQLYNDVGDDV